MTQEQNIPFASLFRRVCEKYKTNPYFSFISTPKSEGNITSFFENNENKMTISRLFSRKNLESLLFYEDLNMADVRGPVDEGEIFVINTLHQSDRRTLVLVAQIVFMLAILERKQQKSPLTYQTTFRGKIADFNRESSGSWYRGQTNSSWGLVPSFLRNVDCPNFSWIGIKDYWRSLDKNNRLARKRFEETMAEPHGRKEIYKETAFLQHSISFSPLIDFTRKFEIAVSFATSNYSDINNFNCEDSAVFVLSFFPFSLTAIRSYTAANKILRNLSICIAKNKIVLGTMTTFYRRDSNGKVIGQKTLDFTTFTSIINALAPRCYLFDLPSNDRMKYQKGTFILFDQFLMVNGMILYNLNPNLHVDQFILTRPNKGSSVKNDLLDEISADFKKYQMVYLMNPYSYFGSKN